MQSLRSSLFRGVRATQMRSVVPARRMGAHAKPEYTGIEAKVRAFFPENYHVSHRPVSLLISTKLITFSSPACLRCSRRLCCSHYLPHCQGWV